MLMMVGTAILRISRLTGCSVIILYRSLSFRSSLMFDMVIEFERKDKPFLCHFVTPTDKTLPFSTLARNVTSNRSPVGA
jgi:hypothetical protein